MADIELDSDEIFALVMDTPAVHAAVAKKAAGVASRARRELSRAGIDATVSVRDHPLPSGRTSRDVIANFDDPKVERRVGKIMRRAGREGR